MKAQFRQFYRGNYRKVADYYSAIADFLTNLGPERVIGIQTKWGISRYRSITNVWYWEE